MIWPRKKKLSAAVAAKCQQCLTFFITRVGLCSLRYMNNFASNLLDLSSENPNIDNKGPCGCA